MKLGWKWILAILLILALIILPLVWRFSLPMGNYPMLRGYGIHAPMMNGYGMAGTFAMWFMWLIPLGVFSLIGFAVGWAANQFTRKSN